MEKDYVSLCSISRLIQFNPNKNLSKHQTAEISNVYPCTYACGANTAIDEDKETCTGTYTIGGNSPHKTTWLRVNLGGYRSIYSINILFQNFTGHEMRQRGRFAGFSLFLSNTPHKENSRLCYNNTLPLPPLEFNTTCIGYGRYVIYYNERLDGVTYPEGYQNQIYTQLCDVKIQGCASSDVYGNQCNKNCSENCQEKKCNIVNGSCLGCIPGWTGDMCTKECSWGLHGPGCKNKCSDHCKRNITCNHMTGHCDGGCTSGWMGKFCNERCKDGTYGPDCVHKCSDHCLNNTYCNRETGYCDQGCSPGYSGDFCNETCRHGYFGNKCLEECHETCKSKKCVNTNGVCIDGCVDGYFGKQCHNVCNLKEDGVHSVKIRTGNVHESAKKGRPTYKTIPVRNLKNIIVKMSAMENAGFKHEYHEIPKGELSACEEAKKPENKPKNRYTTTFPYDHSRVVLKKINEGDYINANYIENIHGQRTYIATQGPKPKTIGDFWKMVWQEDISVIVCLTNLKEGGKNKCAQYWPEINDKLQIEDFTVRHLEEKIYSNYTIRRFKAYNNFEQRNREVVMFHYTRWPDHGVPDSLSLVLFHRHVMRISSEYHGNYTLVHCSAGIGRTGTYIALDALYREGEKNGKVNVPMYVRTMRKDRMNMIQGDDQYKAVYLALCETFNGKSRCLSPSSFTKAFEDKIYTNSGQVTRNSSLTSEFQELLSLRKEYTEKDYESGRTNVSANYTESVLPVEEFLCYLSYTKGRNTYYNAVLLQSFTENDSLISAQYPLPDYTEDFLRLIRDFDARVVVFMCPIKDLKSTSLWLPTKSEHKTVGNFTIKLASSTNSTNYASRNIVLQPEGGRAMGITVLESKTWKEGKMTIDKRALLDLIKETKSEKIKHKEGRVVILSSDGATRCGAFCVVYNALEQLSMDREVDIFTITRQLRIRRPEFVSTLDEYQLCHDAAAEYMQNDSVYANC
ncbi:receptor-type tyrosine-protein phosphatase epsilon-like [Saccostrea echinata]|uniref:receptor-type tyrosine-protein phosphatase epsilon-like n=1 Tax=Saccostrea echinata TaxID=191078 RepID=UPI002A82D080|nr:receptor-type tyrosine-protein phosphatase epsilon-like [Saccostrea echinata]